MEEIPINAKPNQNVLFVYGNYTYIFRFYAVNNGFTLCDVSENGKLIAAGILCSPNKYILPQNREIGNFMFKCVTNDYPYFEFFNNTQKLNFVPLEEIE